MNARRRAVSERSVDPLCCAARRRTRQRVVHHHTRHLRLYTHTPLNCIAHDYMIVLPRAAVATCRLWADQSPSYTRRRWLLGTALLPRPSVTTCCSYAAVKRRLRQHQHVQCCAARAGCVVQSLGRYKDRLRSAPWRMQMHAREGSGVSIICALLPATPPRIRTNTHPHCTRSISRHCATTVVRHCCCATPDA